MDDAIVNGTWSPTPGAPHPLALFKAARIDYSLHRLIHYTGTDPAHFQNFVIFTNYQFYIDAFIRMAKDRMAAGDPDYDCFVEPGNVITRNARFGPTDPERSEEHTSELQSLMRISYAVFCLKKKKKQHNNTKYKTI